MADYNKVGLLITNDDNSKLLLLEERINNDDHNQGTVYKIIGGTIHNGESHHDCLMREVREEISCDVVVGDLVGTYDAPAAGQPGKTVSITLYIGELDGEIHVGEDPDLVDIVWIAPDLNHPKIQANTILKEHILPDLLQRNII